jgi:hypothetical protein
MPKHKTLPPLEVLEREFIYESDTGLFRHRYYKCGRALKDQIAGTINRKGYVVIRIQSNIVYQAHRVAWYMYHKQDPVHNLIDHIDRCKHNNAISNLRLGTDNTNQWNRKARGYHKYGNKYQACIRHHKKHIHLGTFATAEEARAAYIRAALELRGEYALQQFRELALPESPQGRSGAT